jgi:hypothetical protein
MVRAFDRGVRSSENDSGKVLSSYQCHFELVGTSDAEEILTYNFAGNLQVAIYLAFAVPQLMAPETRR